MTELELLESIDTTLLIIMFFVSINTGLNVARTIWGK